MTKKIFVTATNTGVGKTHTCLALMQKLFLNGVRAAPFKPIETGVLDEKESDAYKLLKSYQALSSDTTLKIDDISPYRFALAAAPFVSKGKADIQIEKIEESLKRLEKRADVVLIEGAGGLFVPIERDYFMIDLAKKLADFVLLVSHTELGCINDALLSHMALKMRSIQHEIVFNRRDGDNFETISLPYFQAAKIPVATKVEELKIFGELICQ